MSSTAVTAVPIRAYRFHGAAPPARLRCGPELVGSGEYLRDENILCESFLSESVLVSELTVDARLVLLAEVDLLGRR